MRPERCLDVCDFDEGLFVEGGAEISRRLDDFFSNRGEAAG